MLERNRAAYHVVRKQSLMGFLIHGLKVVADDAIPGILLLDNLTEARREGSAIIGPEHAILEVDLENLPTGALDKELAKRAGVPYGIFARHTWSSIDLGPERLSHIP